MPAQPHSLAARLYILQAVPSVKLLTGPNATQILGEELFERLSQVPDDGLELQGDDVAHIPY